MIRSALLACFVLLAPAAWSGVAAPDSLLSGGRLLAQHHYHGGYGAGRHLGLGLGGGGYGLYSRGYGYAGYGGFHGYPSYASGMSGLGGAGLSYGYRGLGYGGIGLGVRNYGYGYNNFGPTYNSFYPYGFNGSYGPYSIYGPLTLPTNSLYGAAAAQSVMPAMNPLPASGPVVTTIRVPNNAAPAVAARPAARPVGDRASAQKHLAAGDAEFAKQQFQSAYLEYQRAKQADGEWAEPYFRRGWALTALSRYHLAAQSFQEGFRRDPNWTQSPFRLDELYAGNKMAKEAHIDAMATKAQEDPSDSDVWMILGLSLFFDGQPERSQVFFNRSAESAPVGDQGLIKSFLLAKQPTEDREI